MTELKKNIDFFSIFNALQNLNAMKTVNLSKKNALTCCIGKGRNLIISIKMFILQESAAVQVHPD